MNNGRNIEIVDLYEWLPGCRAASVRIRMENGDLLVTIVYDGPEGARERTLLFSFVCSFSMEAFSSTAMLCEQDATVLNGAVVEHPDSEAAIAWSKHFGRWRVVRHYSIAFLSENLLLVILAGGVAPAG
jgi:hypothetical protein